MEDGSDNGVVINLPDSPVADDEPKLMPEQEIQDDVPEQKPQRGMTRHHSRHLYLALVETAVATKDSPDVEVDVFECDVSPVGDADAEEDAKAAEPKLHPSPPMSPEPVDFDGLTEEEAEKKRVEAAHRRMLKLGRMLGRTNSLQILNNAGISEDRQKVILKKFGRSDSLAAVDKQVVETQDPRFQSKIEVKGNFLTVIQVDTLDDPELRQKRLDKLCNLLGRSASIMDLSRAVDEGTSRIADKKFGRRLSREQLRNNVGASPQAAGVAAKRLGNANEDEDAPRILGMLDLPENPMFMDTMSLMTDGEVAPAVRRSSSTEEPIDAAADTDKSGKRRSTRISRRSSASGKSASEATTASSSRSRSSTESGTARNDVQTTQVLMMIEADVDTFSGDVTIYSLQDVDRAHEEAQRRYRRFKKLARVLGRRKSIENMYLLAAEAPDEDRKVFVKKFGRTASLEDLAKQSLEMRGAKEKPVAPEEAEPDADEGEDGADNADQDGNVPDKSKHDGHMSPSASAYLVDDPMAQNQGKVSAAEDRRFRKLVRLTGREESLTNLSQQTTKHAKTLGRRQSLEDVSGQKMYVPRNDPAYQEAVATPWKRRSSLAQQAEPEGKDDEASSSGVPTTCEDEEAAAATQSA